MGTIKNDSPREVLSTLWIFITVNYIFCDVFTLMNPEELKQILSGTVGAVTMNEQFLLITACVMEIPMAMILVSRLAKFELISLLNIIAAGVMIVSQGASLFVSGNSSFYIFFSIIEIATAIAIGIIAFGWRKERAKSNDILLN